MLIQYIKFNVLKRPKLFDYLTSQIHNFSNWESISKKEKKSVGFLIRCISKGNGLFLKIQINWMEASFREKGLFVIGQDNSPS